MNIRSLFLATFLLTAGAGARAAEEESLSEQAREILASIEAAKRTCPAAAPGARDAKGADECEIPGGEFSEAEARPEPALETAPSAPLNTGFRALGEAGQKGSVDGPGGKGNGSYTVLKNGKSEVALKLSTGYIDGEFHLLRDPATGTDTLHFIGRKWLKEKSAWGPHEDNIVEAQFTYDAKADTGRIRYKAKNSQWKQESYWNGKAGRVSMVIEFGGGWDHTLSRN